MTHLTRWSLANRLIVGLATIAIVVFGLISTFNLKQELLPSTTVPTAVITAATRAPPRRSSPTTCPARSNGQSPASPA